MQSFCVGKELKLRHFSIACKMYNYPSFAKDDLASMPT